MLKTEDALKTIVSCNEQDIDKETLDGLRAVSGELTRLEREVLLAKLMVVQDDRIASELTQVLEQNDTPKDLIAFSSLLSAYSISDGDSRHERFLLACSVDPSPCKIALVDICSDKEASDQHANAAAKLLVKHFPIEAKRLGLISKLAKSLPADSTLNSLYLSAVCSLWSDSVEDRDEALRNFQDGKAPSLLSAALGLSCLRISQEKGSDQPIRALLLTSEDALHDSLAKSFIGIVH